VQKAAAGGNVFYQNCTAVKQVGAALIRVGDPGWGTKFDRDGDGVCCESWAVSLPPPYTREHTEWRAR
jgi:hypothetical protein